MATKPATEEMKTMLALPGCRRGPDNTSEPTSVGVPLASAGGSAASPAVEERTRGTSGAAGSTGAAPAVAVSSLCFSPSDVGAAAVAAVAAAAALAAAARGVVATEAAALAAAEASRGCASWLKWYADSKLVANRRCKSASVYSTVGSRLFVPTLLICD